jgi:hypothetical protein
MIRPLFERGSDKVVSPARRQSRFCGIELAKASGSRLADRACCRQDLRC